MQETQLSLKPVLEGFEQLPGYLNHHTAVSTAQEGGMGGENTTSWTKFVLAGLQHQKSPTTFLVVILFMSCVALIGNNLLLVLIKTDPGLKTPMYFFLSQLAFMDLCQILSIVPQMTVNFATQAYGISLYGCVVQISVTLALGGAECLILATMSYDRYVAICRPLQYPVLMRREICYGMSVGVWFWSSVQALTCSLYVLPLPYCKSNVIDHYVCDYPALVQLSCSDTSAFEKTTYLGDFLVFLLPLSVIFFSYLAILLQILRKRSSERSHKALGTCLSHLCVVGLFYGAAILVYMTPVSTYSPQKAMINTLFTTIVPAMMNPFIYSLRNRDVLAALRKLFGRHMLHK
ncbi:olfactory receptor 2M5-like [Elgaria multicarinata webbii]|uniref:olfactory receptor 2M5-like n=1 Tax=Elgaria multicarinata webbii TaxID=159646 RepID=UPI002FCD0B14